MRYIACLLVTAAIVSACSSLKRSQGGFVNQNHAAGTSSEVAASAGDVNAITKPDTAARAEKTSSASVTEKEKHVAPNVKPRSYSGLQTEHVRVPGITTLAPGAELVVPLGGTDDFCYPYRGKVISQYGYRGRSFHSGVDIKAVPMDTIRAAMSGVVRMARMYSGYGNVVVVNHDNGLETVYAHHARMLVKPNDIVAAGDPIALAGRTGRATTEHLHFEVRVSGQPLNPNLFLDYEGQCLRPDTLFVCNRAGKIRASNSRAVLKGYNDADNNTVSPVAAGGFDEDTVERSAAAANAVKATDRQVSQQATAPRYHKVVKGDTLSRIARTYGTTVARLCSLNNIKQTKILQLGERLRVK